MKRVNSWIVLAALLTAGFGVQQQDAGSAAQIQALEKRVEVLEKYVQNQARAAEALGRSLDESDAQGFTYGINPTSRKVLLAGLRGVAGAAQLGVPGAEVGAKEEPAKPEKPVPVPAPEPVPEEKIEEVQEEGGGNL